MPTIIVENLLALPRMSPEVSVPVTYIFDGEVVYHDSNVGSDVIGEGDIRWMAAGASFERASSWWPVDPRAHRVLRPMHHEQPRGA